MKQSGHLNSSQKTGWPVTSKYGRTLPIMHGCVGRQHLVVDGVTFGCVQIIARFSEMA